MVTYKSSPEINSVSGVDTLKKGELFPEFQNRVSSTNLNAFSLFSRERNFHRFSCIERERELAHS